ncbi:rod shape-determining protein RodA [Intestinibacillus massiliensis]|uniref:FtsW/RodA/SpoVE family cell cycle protein n=1 Tax=Intestinibacillus massiliensis TaxID=1871029 RepID=UPI001356529C|nr:FtsW/RodA/SpoVE family cell cycle protein [Intestinibacillus massiliensis]MCB6366211.1 rod shape-determining protein RodA [Intestinibacillus massiliensis]
MRPLRALGHYIRHTDLYLLVLALACSGYGVALIYSATRAYGTNKYIYMQLAAIAIGVVAFVIMSLLDLETIAPVWKWVFLLNFGFQCVLFTPIARDVGGNRSWISLGPLSLQPAEIGKLLFIFTFAAHLSSVRDRLNHWKTLLPLALHLFAMMGVIIVSSRDMGMSLSYFAICVIMLFAAGLSLKWFAGGAVLGIASIPFLWNFVLKNYQITRILVLFDPSIDPEKAWQTTQSKIAIGAGQMYGEGFLQGNQTQYNMLPAKHTDFIFSVAGEELGFIGSCAIVGLLALLILRLFYVTFKANSSFSSLLVMGIAGMIFFQTFENIFMCLGLLPVMGLTLPFFSYGGTSVITMFAAVGIAAGVRMREKPSWLQR